MGCGKVSSQAHWWISMEVMFTTHTKGEGENVAIPLQSHGVVISKKNNSSIRVRDPKLSLLNLNQDGFETNLQEHVFYYYPLDRCQEVKLQISSGVVTTNLGTFIVVFYYFSFFLSRRPKPIIDQFRRPNPPSTTTTRICERQLGMKQLWLILVWFKHNDNHLRSVNNPFNQCVL